MRFDFSTKTDMLIRPPDKALMSSLSNILNHGSLMIIEGKRSLDDRLIYKKAPPGKKSLGSVVINPVGHHQCGCSGQRFSCVFPR